MTDEHLVNLQQMGQNVAKHTREEGDVVTALSEAFSGSPLPLSHRLGSFARHVRRQDIARFVTKYELFKLSMPANGSVVECGVFAGAGLMSWYHFSSILEPYNHTRRIIGFDTFEGFPGLDSNDTSQGSSDHLYVGALQTHDSIMDELNHLISIHDRNRPLGHVPKIELVKGNAIESMPRYVDEHPHLLISLIYLDFDLYEPTKVALGTLYPRVVKGGIVAFDELNCPDFPGETTALIETVDLKNVELRRFPQDPYISYFVKGH